MHCIVKTRYPPCWLICSEVPRYCSSNDSAGRSDYLQYITYNALQNSQNGACLILFIDLTLLMTVVLPAVPSEKRAANASRRKFAADTYSDHMTLLRAFQVSKWFICYNCDLK